ncbi:uncharacterized protein [Antedon mediterranea]|uniref:uncharacterized protein n=1 Tax=Antedon mediterranea TaxID=105859 RepID=UPI003AF78CAB
MTVDIHKIRVCGSRPGRVAKSRVARNLFGTTSEDHAATDAWLKNELKQSCLEDRKKLESLGLDPDTEMPVNNSTSRWEWSLLDGKSCPNMYRTREIITKFVTLSTNSTDSTENNGLDNETTMQCSSTVTSPIATQHEEEPSSSSQTPKQYKQTTITDFLPKRRLVFRPRQKLYERSMSRSSTTKQQSHTNAKSA